MQVPTRLRESSVGDLLNQVGTAADRGEEAAEYRPLRFVAPRDQRTDQRRRLAFACKRFGLVRVPWNLHVLILGNSLDEFER